MQVSYGARKSMENSLCSGKYYTHSLLAPEIVLPTKETLYRDVKCFHVCTILQSSVNNVIHNTPLLRS